MLFDAIKRSILVALADTDGGGVRQLLVSALGELWTRDAQAQPAQTWTPITPSVTTFALQTPPIAFRALRFDAAGTVIFTAAGAAGSQTRNVSAGEVWSASSNAILSITGGSSTVIDGLG